MGAVLNAAQIQRVQYVWFTGVKWYSGRWWNGLFPSNFHCKYQHCYETSLTNSTFTLSCLYVLFKVPATWTFGAAQAGELVLIPMAGLDKYELSSEPCEIWLILMGDICRDANTGIYKSGRILQGIIWLRSEKKTLGDGKMKELPSRFCNFTYIPTFPQILEINK